MTSPEGGLLAISEPRKALIAGPDFLRYRAAGAVAVGCNLYRLASIVSDHVAKPLTSLLGYSSRWKRLTSPSSRACRSAWPWSATATVVTSSSFLSRCGACSDGTRNSINGHRNTSRLHPSFRSCRMARVEQIRRRQAHRAHSSVSPGFTFLGASPRQPLGRDLWL